MLTIYSDLLVSTVAESPQDSWELSALAVQALEHRRALRRRTHSSLGRDAPSLLVDSLSYDAALVRLCRRLSIEEHLTTGSNGPAARRDAESAVARKLPLFAAMLDDADHA